MLLGVVFGLSVNVLHRAIDEFPPYAEDIVEVDLHEYCESGIGYCLSDEWLTCFNHRWIKLPIVDGLACKKRGRTILFTKSQL